MNSFVQQFRKFKNPKLVKSIFGQFSKCRQNCNFQRRKVRVILVRRLKSLLLRKCQIQCIKHKLHTLLAQIIQKNRCQILSIFHQHFFPANCNLRNKLSTMCHSVLYKRAKFGLNRINSFGAVRTDASSKNLGAAHISPIPSSEPPPLPISHGQKSLIVDLFRFPIRCMLEGYASK